MTQNITTELAHFKYLDEWSPQVGDIVVYHGWVLNHWYGVISAINQDAHTINVIHKGLPVLMLTLDPGEYNDNSSTVAIANIRRSTGGKYAIIRSISNNVVWFI